MNYLFEILEILSSTRGRINLLSITALTFLLVACSEPKCGEVYVPSNKIYSNFSSPQAPPRINMIVRGDTTKAGGWGTIHLDNGDNVRELYPVYFVRFKGTFVVNINGKVYHYPLSEVGQLDHLTGKTLCY